MTAHLVDVTERAVRAEQSPLLNRLILDLATANGRSDDAERTARGLPTSTTQETTA